MTESDYQREQAELNGRSIILTAGDDTDPDAVPAVVLTERQRRSRDAVSRLIGQKL